MQQDVPNIGQLTTCLFKLMGEVRTIKNDLKRAKKKNPGFLSVCLLFKHKCYGVIIYNMQDRQDSLESDSSVLSPSPSPAPSHGKGSNMLHSILYLLDTFLLLHLHGFSIQLPYSWRSQWWTCKNWRIHSEAGQGEGSVDIECLFTCAEANGSCLHKGGDG